MRRSKCFFAVLKKNRLGETEGSGVSVLVGPVLDQDLGLSFDLLMVKNGSAGAALENGWEKHLG